MAPIEISRSFFMFSPRRTFLNPDTSQPYEVGECVMLHGRVDVYDEIPMMDIQRGPLLQCEPGMQVLGPHSVVGLGTQNGSHAGTSQPVPSGSGSHGKQRSSQCASGPQSKPVQVDGGRPWHSKWHG